MPRLIGKRASAGSGKTFALALRFLELLFESPPCPEHLGSIIAITFTNKAAAEMKERILRFLKELAFETDFAENVLKKELEKAKFSPELAQTWVDTIVENYFDFQVRTIDSFLLSILRGLSFELGIKPDSRVLFQKKQVLEEVFEELLSELARKDSPLRNAWQEALETFLLHDEKGGFYPENELKKHFLDNLYPKLNLGSDEDFLCLSSEEKEEFEEKKKRLKELYEGLYYLVKDLGIKTSRRLPAPWEISWDKLIDWEEKGTFLDCLEGVKETKELYNEIKALGKEIRDWYLEKFVYCRLAGYYKILKAIKKRVEERAVEEGLLLGSEHWTALILKVLKKEDFPPLVYAYFGKKFKHFLFDEFQDTSRPHWEALLPLLEELFASEEKGSLFVVGDPKQAIYGWRGGDWTIYHQLFDRENPLFPSLRPEEIVEEVLPKNYRSHPELVAFFNCLFEHFARKDLLQKKVQSATSKTARKSIPEFLLGSSLEDTRESFLKSLTKSFEGHTQESAVKIEEEALIKPFFLKTSTKEDFFERLKEELVSAVKDEWERLKEKKGNIAILVRKNDQAEEVSSWLLEEGIPVITENALKISMCPKVKGLIALLKVIEEPGEELYAYGVLASGLLQGIFPELPSGEEELLERWQEEKEEFLKRVFEFAEGLKERVPGGEAYELIWETINTLGISLDKEPFVERLLEVAHLYSLEKGPGLSGFLSFWEEGGAEQRIGLPENIEAVRVLTIHKAKGLEFDTVFLPFTDWRLSYQGLFEEVEKEGKKCLVCLGKNLPSELKLLKGEKLAREAQEMLNLFYVALTRAKKRLYIFFPAYPTKGITPLSAWMQNLVKDALNKLYEEGF
jgi:ATP-dependent exoDNAse (exonuclease V) beta subunit